MKTSLSKKGNTYQGKKVTLNNPFYTPGERKKLGKAKFQSLAAKGRRRAMKEG